MWHNLSGSKPGVGDEIEIRNKDGVSVSGIVVNVMDDRYSTVVMDDGDRTVHCQGFTEWREGVYSAGLVVPEATVEDDDMDDSVEDGVEDDEESDNDEG